MRVDGGVHLPHARGGDVRRLRRRGGLGDPQRRSRSTRRRRAGSRSRTSRSATGSSSSPSSATPPTAPGVHKAVDPADGEVYLWMSFEPDEARFVWACFDQPDLKAPWRITVTAPAAWRVLSNSGDETVDEVEDGRRWSFPPTPPLSSYNPVVLAGPFHELRREVGRPRPRHPRPAVAGAACSSATPRSSSRSPSRGWRSSPSSSACRSRSASTTRCSSPSSAARWRTTAA